MLHNLSIGGGPMVLDAAGVASGQAFLQGELEKRDPKLLEPLKSVTWMRDIYAETGGGFVDFTSNIYVDYATSGTNQYGIINGATNNIPTIQANFSKDIFTVFPWANIIKVPFMDQQRMSTIGRSLDEQLDNGLRLAYNKALDQNVYFGFTDYGTTGLINSASIASGLAPAGASTSRSWALKTPNEILADVNTVLTATWASSEYDITGMANQILIPPAVFGYINTTLISSAGNQSIYSYLMANNIAKAQGVDLVIAPARQCIGAGVPLTTGGANSNRLVAYRNDKDRVSFDIPVPLSRVMTQADVNQLSYLTAYVAQMGQVKFKYTQCAYYMDGI